MSNNDNPYANRYGNDDTSDEEETDETTETEDTSDTSDTSHTDETKDTSTTQESSGTDGTPVGERTDVSMYLYDDLVSDLRIGYSEMNVKWNRAYDEDLPKNDEFYPALVRAGLKHIEEELDLPDDS